MQIRLKPEILGPLRKDSSPNLTSLFRDWYRLGHKIVGVSGPRNCSKTATIAILLLWLHQQIPGLHSRVARSEASTIKSTIIDTFEELLAYPFGDRRNPFTLYGGPNRPEHILFDNGGKMLFGGMDNQADKLLGAGCDVFFYNQIERELDVENFQKIMGCMAGGRKGRLMDRDGNRSFLFIGDANPSFKKHWFYQMKDDIAWYDITHQDHPLFYDWLVNDWKEHGKRTIDDLEATHPPGHMRDRMVYGKWCNPEGAVYPQYNPDIHDKDIQRDGISVDAKWRYSCDWGNINAVGLYADNYNGKHCLFKEIYRKGESVQDIIERMRALEKQYHIPKITDVFVDHEIDNRFQMREAGYPYTLAAKTEKAGCIEDVRYALVNELIYFNKHSLEDPDPKLRGKAQRTTDEISALAYKDEDKMTGTRSDDLPDNKYPDHGGDHLQYYTVGCVVKRKKPDMISFKIKTPSRLG